MIHDSLSQCTQRYWRDRNSVVGAFWDIDFLLFDRILAMQRERGIHGDLLEIGALFGKSAIVLGCHAWQEEDEVIVCDIFNEIEGDPQNVAENSQSYSGLNRKKFEQNYSRWVDRRPVIIAELSKEIVNRVNPRSLRFAHIDGSHLYDVVRMDISNTRGLMNDRGVVVMDDFRARHTPGVAAAVWEAVANEGLIPICISEQKFYGAWDPETARTANEGLTHWVSSHADTINYGVQDVAGANVLLIQNPAPWMALTIIISKPAYLRELKRRVERFLPFKPRSARRRASPARPYLGSRSIEVP